MTPELAKLIDGPVAERWGRPENDRYSLMFFPHMSPPKQWLWCAKPSEPKQPADIITSTIETEALWLAHLLAVCGDRGWIVQINPPMPISRNVIVTISQYEWNGDDYSCRESATHLEALARAMLAVPTPPPHPAQG